MKFNIKNGSVGDLCTSCLIIGVYEEKVLPDTAKALDVAVYSLISKILKQEDIDGKVGSFLMLQQVGNGSFERILLVGLGKKSKFSARTYREVNNIAMREVLKTSASEALNCLLELDCQQDIDWKIEQAVLAYRDNAYLFEQFKSKGYKNIYLKQISLIIPPDADIKKAKSGLKNALSLANGIDLAKDLGNLPANICTPTYIAECAKKLAKDFSIEVEVLDTNAIKKEGMLTLLSVAKGSEEPPKFIVLKYNGSPQKSTRPIVLVGKGITFDSGGISLKPGAGMEEMKYDMSGAGAVLGAFSAALESKLPINLIALIPSCENMPSGHASRPGDIVKTKEGLSVEILNTDAEGRLILCDALSYAKKFNPQTIIDVATLTGACIVALGSVASGLFSNQDDLAKELLDSGEEIGDRAWHLPLWDDYQEQLKSPFADLANIGGRDAGSITAACFLSQFVNDFSWAHLDVAGTASWRGSGQKRGSTGRPVPLLVQFLRSRAKSKKDN